MRWRTSTTLSKPKKLSGEFIQLSQLHKHTETNFFKLLGDPKIDVHIFKKIDDADLIEENGTMKLQPAFPALPWAHAFIHLIDLSDDSLLESMRCLLLTFTPST